MKFLFLLDFDLAVSEGRFRQYKESLAGRSFLRRPAPLLPLPPYWLPVSPMTPPPTPPPHTGALGYAHLAAYAPAGHVRCSGGSSSSSSGGGRRWGCRA